MKKKLGFIDLACQTCTHVASKPIHRRHKSVLPLVASLAIALAATPAVASTTGGGQKPQMGWSSWSFLRNNVTDTKIEAQASAMSSSGLQNLGYNFVNIDDGWYLDATTNVDNNGYWVNDTSKFPNGVAAVASYVHNLGLKFGIYLTPGIPVGAYNKNTPIAGTSFHAQDIVSDTNNNENSYTFHKSMYFIDYNKNPSAAQAYINGWANLLASWGVDYVKLDGVGTSDSSDVIAWNKALAQSGRTIHLALSNSLDINNGNLWRQNSNSWRISGDIECYCSTLTDWGRVSSRFNQLPQWTQFAGPGGWNDPDSVEVGNGSSTGLTTDERKTQLTLWAVSAAPLILGTNLTSLDSADLALLKNTEVIAIDQAGTPAHPISQSSNQQVWSAHNNSDGTYTVALFNLGESSATVTANWSDLGFNGTAAVRDVWSQSNLGNYNGSFSATVPSHGSQLLKVTPPSGSGSTSLFVNGATSRCMENNSSASGSTQSAQIDDCVNPREASQLITYASDNSMRSSGMCLDVYQRGTTSGSPVQFHQCNGQTNQQWYLQNDGSIVGKQSQLCLDTANGSTSSANGTALVLARCSGSNTQTWLPR